MSQDLRPENEAFIASAVSDGAYGDREAVLNDAVDLLRRRDALVREVNAGIDALRRGEGARLNGDEELRRFMDHLKARGRGQLTEASGK